MAMHDWDAQGWGRRFDPFDVGGDRAGVFSDRVVRGRATVLQNEVDTRRLLARVVYRVPDAWLDEVVRVRLADLDLPDLT